jgi:drug/metabolite transporter (DMT)-like permease
MHYLLLTLVTIFLWSSLAPIVAELSHVPPFFLLSCSLLIGGSLSLTRAKQWQFSAKLLLVGVGGIFGYHFLLFMALRLAPPVAANLLNYLWPLLILLLTPIFFPNIELTKRQVFGAFVSLIGAALIVASNGIEFSGEDMLGYMLAIMAAFSWACYSLLSKKMATFSSATVGLFCLISGVLAGASHSIFEVTPALNVKDMILIFILGVGPLGLSFYCWDAAIKLGDPRVIATLSYLTPLLSTLLLVIFSNQPFTDMLLIAMLMIVVGALIANIKRRRIGR